MGANNKEIIDMLKEEYVTNREKRDEEIRLLTEKHRENEKKSLEFNMEMMKHQERIQQFQDLLDD